jgi:signal transduction histidine kinase
MSFQADLREIYNQSQHLLDSTINAQQRAFIVYIANTARRLIAQLAPLPQTEDAYRQVIPSLGSAFHKSLAVLYGYARMLIDQPEKFSPSKLRVDQTERLERIYRLGLGLSQQAQRHCDLSKQEVVQQRRAPAEVVNLSELLRLEEPLWRYWLQHSHVYLHLMGLDEALEVVANRYHLRQLVRHITLTMAQEMVTGGRIMLEVVKETSRVSLLYHSPDLTWTADALAALFIRQGRDVYAAYLTRYGGTWRVEPRAEGGDVLIISLPSAS